MRIGINLDQLLSNLAPLQKKKVFVKKLDHSSVQLLKYKSTPPPPHTHTSKKKHEFRKQLFPFKIKARRKGHKVLNVRDELYIDGKEHTPEPNDLIDNHSDRLEKELNNTLKIIS